MARMFKRALSTARHLNASFVLAALLLLTGVLLQRALAEIIQDETFAAIVVLVIVAPLGSLGSKPRVHH
jgi:hypothetical protein